MRDCGVLIEVIRGLDEIEWSKSPLLGTGINLTGPAQGMRCNQLRLCRETFKSRNNCARSVTQRHNFFTNILIPRWNKLP